MSAPVDDTVGDGVDYAIRQLVWGPPAERPTGRKLVRAEPCIVMTMQPGPYRGHGLAQLGSGHLWMPTHVSGPLCPRAVTPFGVRLLCRWFGRMPSRSSRDDINIARHLTQEHKD